jgi:hypothetical protein
MAKKTKPDNSEQQQPAWDYEHEIDSLRTKVQQAEDLEIIILVKDNKRQVFIAWKSIKSSVMDRIYDIVEACIT